LSQSDSTAPTERFAALPSLLRGTGGPVFAEPWEAQAFALAVKLSEQPIGIVSLQLGQRRPLARRTWSASRVWDSASVKVIAARTRLILCASQARRWRDGMPAPQPENQALRLRLAEFRAISGVSCKCRPTEPRRSAPCDFYDAPPRLAMI
jgi:hypothetical protein